MQSGFEGSGRFGARGLVDRIEENTRLLGARYRDLVAQDEEGHAVDSEVDETVDSLPDGLFAFARSEYPACRGAIEPGLGRDLRELTLLADRPAFEEVRAKQSLDQRFRVPARLCPC